MSSNSKYMYIVSAKEYLKIDPFVLRGEIAAEVMTPQNLVHVHVVTVVAQGSFSSNRFFLP